MINFFWRYYAVLLSSSRKSWNMIMVVKTSKYRSSQEVINIKRRLEQCSLVFFNQFLELHWSSWSRKSQYLDLVYRVVHSINTRYFCRSFLFELLWSWESGKLVCIWSSQPIELRSLDQILTSFVDHFFNHLMPGLIVIMYIIIISIQGRK